MHGGCLTQLHRRGLTGNVVLGLQDLPEMRAEARRQHRPRGFRLIGSGPTEATTGGLKHRFDGDTRRWERPRAGTVGGDENRDAVASARSVCPLTGCRGQCLGVFGPFFLVRVKP